MRVQYLQVHGEASQQRLSLTEINRAVQIDSAGAALVACMNKHLALVMLLAGSAVAQAPAPQAPKKAVVEADVVLVGCPPKFFCGGIAALQSVALRITKVDSGPLKAGDTTVMDVLACFPGPLLVSTDPTGLVELDPKQIRRGSKIKVELDVSGLYGSSTTSDKITVKKL